MGIDSHVPTTGVRSQSFAVTAEILPVSVAPLERRRVGALCCAAFVDSLLSLSHKYLNSLRVYSRIDSAFLLNIANVPVSAALHLSVYSPTEGHLQLPPALRS